MSWETEILRDMDDSFAHALEALTSAQREAVEHIEGPLLILAGPGSGKTRVVTHRVAHLLRHGVAPREILALTFTNKAADEMRSRLERLAPQQPVWIGTFHRFCARLLRRYARYVGLSENYTIYDTADSSKALRMALEELSLNLAHFTPDQLAQAISWAKNELITSEQYQPRPGNPLGAVVAKVYPAYQRRLLASNAVDFDDLLMHVATMLRENPELRSSLDAQYRFILVDEYQDTNLAQYAIVRALSVDFPNLAVTGDPDQSIYGWRGANLKNILEFEKDFPEVKVVRLEQNYRSTKTILRAADALIAHNKHRKKKALFTDNDEGRPVRLTVYPTHRDEAEGIVSTIAAAIHAGRRRPSDFAVFYRTNALSRTLEEAFREHAVPYQIVNGVEFYQRKEIKDVIAYLQLINNPQNDVAFMRIINLPSRGIGKTTLARLSDYAGQKRMSRLEAARQCTDISTIKPSEAKSVREFVSLYDDLASRAIRPVEEILGHVLTKTGYHDLLKNSDVPEDQERLANIEELVTAAREFDERFPEQDSPLEAFLEQASLVNDIDAMESSSDVVTLLTLHAGKGLEFPVVFVTAIEQGLLPHELNREDEFKLEEERRLLFVGMTRAEEELHLSMASYRTFRGQRHPTIASPFLMELPRDEMDVEEIRSSRFVEPSWDDEPSHDDSHFFDEPAIQVGELNEESDARSSPKHLLSTAAELLPDASPSTTGNAEKISPDVFRLGMTVIHPTYGLGKITAISGTGAKRTATVNFCLNPGETKFRLAYSPLRPAQK
jgi:DNA helicase-2/ATP-dependent DNA helicase PcrA